jgi:pimeloyl-ACP methyl ester carboxylesterase
MTVDLETYPSRAAIYRSSDGIKIVGDELGPDKGPLVVLMHGGGQTRHSWSGAADHLAAAGYKVRNFDLRGHGDSDWSSAGAYSLDDRVDDLKAVMADHAGDVALVGASLGGATALHAVATGLRVRGLIMVDIVPDPEEAGIDNIRAFMRSGFAGFADLEEAAEAVAAYNPDRPRPRDPSGLMKNLRQRDGRLHWHWDPRILDRDNNMQKQVRLSAEQMAASNPCPTLVVRGMSSDVVSDAGIAAFRELLPELEVHNVAGAGHMVAGDRNDAFNDGVLAFLGRVLPINGN